MLFLYRVYQICVMLPLMLTATVITALTAIAGASLGAGRWAGYYPERIWSRVMCWLAFVRVRAVGRENIDPRQSYIFVANHQGAYDIFTIYGWLGHQFRWMMKKELRRIPLVGYACERIQQIYVDRSTPSALRHTMERAERLLRSGLSVVVFPEGARTWDGKMRAFKRGAFILAEEFHLPVVPLTIDGAFDVLPRFKRFPVPGTITLTIHPAINPPADGSHYNLAELMSRCKSTIESALPDSSSSN